MGNRRYSPAEKGAAVKLAQEIGGKEAAVKLQIPEDTLYTWLAKARKGTLQTEPKVSSEHIGDKKKARLQEENASLKKELAAMKALKATPHNHSFTTFFKNRSTNSLKFSAIHQGLHSNSNFL